MKIRNFIHKGLKKLYLEDRAKGLPPEAVVKLRAMLTFLQDMQDPDNLPMLDALAGLMDRAREHLATGDVDAADRIVARYRDLYRTNADILE